MNNLEKAQWLSDRWAEVAQGGVWECHWGKWAPAEHGPDLESPVQDWRVVMPPKLKKIDLIPLIGSGLDCEFSDSGSIWFPQGPLLAIHGSKYVAKSEEWNHCQPRRSPHVHYWGGGDVCPVPEGFVIQVEWYDTLMYGFNENGFPNYSVFNWAEIVAFRILRVADDYTLGGDK